MKMKLFLALLGLISSVSAIPEDYIHKLAYNVRDRGYYSEGEGYRERYVPQYVDRSFESEGSRTQYGEGKKAKKITKKTRLILYKSIFERRRWREDGIIWRKYGRKI